MWIIPGMSKDTIIGVYIYIKPIFQSELCLISKFNTCKEIYVFVCKYLSINIWNKIFNKVLENNTLLLVKTVMNLSVN